MAIFPFVGTGTDVADFTVDDVIISSPLVKGEKRMYSPFPYPVLDTWRRHALNSVATLQVLSTQCRITLLFALEADMHIVFYEVTDIDPKLLAGRYNYKKKASLVDQELTTPYTLSRLAMAELRQQQIPEQYVELIQQRVESDTLNHRIAGLCAAVYLTALILEEAEAIK